MPLQFRAHPGMITAEEEEFILQIISNEKDIEHSCFVEVGPWLGKSSYCILNGIHSLNPNIQLDEPKLLCIDRFKWSRMYAAASENYTDFLTYYSLDKLLEGDCFQAAFDKIMADHSSNIPVRSIKKEVSEIGLSDFTSFSSDRRISAFFIDASKNWEDNYFLLASIQSFVERAENEVIIYLQDALHPTAYRLLNLLVLSQGISWYSYSQRTGTALAITASNRFTLPSYKMSDFDVSYLFANWNILTDFLAGHHLSDMSNLALASFLIFTNHQDVGSSIASEVLRGMDDESIALFERLAGNKVIKQYKSLKLL
jgi:hypothetical protein